MPVQFQRTMYFGALERELVSGRAKFPSPLPVPPPPSKGPGWVLVSENVVPGPQPGTFLFFWLWVREISDVSELPGSEPEETVQ